MNQSTRHSPLARETMAFVLAGGRGRVTERVHSTSLGDRGGLCHLFFGGSGPDSPARPRF